VNYLSAELKRIGERIDKPKNLSTMREGRGYDDDWLPDRMLSDLTIAIAADFGLSAEELLEMNQQYYRARG
jgi:aldehyde:ferredoxin oxidoreductase